MGDLAAELLAVADLPEAAVNDDDAGDEGGGGEAAAAVTSIFERVQSLAAENESLRSLLAEERASHLGLLEANRELEWRVKTGTGPGAPAAAMQEWEEAEAKLSLLLAENNELENRERQTAEELRRERATTAQLMASHAEALGVAQQAQNAADAADAAAREEAAASRDAADAAREAQALAGASDMALSNLRNELAAARAEGQATHRELAKLRHELERTHAAHAAHAAEVEQKRSAERAAHAELERRLSTAHAELQRGEAALAESRGHADGHALAAERMRDAVEIAQAEAARQASAAAESARVASLASQREAELEEQVQVLSRKLDGGSEALERQSAAAQRTVATSALAHASALQAAQDALTREQTLAAERELGLQTVVQELKSSLETEGRERTRLQHAYDAAVAQVSLVRSQTAEAAAGGDVALREEAMGAKSRAEESELQCRMLRSQLKEAKDEAAMERARAESEAQKLERAEILSHRKVALAEERRDLMSARLEAAMSASQAAIAEAEQMCERRRSEADSMRAHAKREVDAMREQVDALKVQLRDAAEAASGLQGLLEAQQKVAEAYRGEATRTLARLSQLETAQQPLQQTLASYRQEEASARQALAMELHAQQASLQRALSQSLEAQRTGSISDVVSGLDDLRSELRAAREREEEQRLALNAARLVVQ